MRKVGGLFYPQNPKKEVKDLPRHVIPTDGTERRDLPKWQILSCVGNFCNLGGFLHSADAAVGMTYLGGVAPFIHTGCFCNVSRNGTQAVPYGFAGWWILSSARVVFVTLLGGAPRSESKSIDCRGQSHLDSIDESSPLHCVVPFKHTGYNCHVPRNGT